MKSPRSNDEQARLAALHRYNILDTAPEQDFDDLTLLAAHICRAPIALITLIDGDRQWIKSGVGWDVREMARDVSFCHHAIVDPDVFVVPDALADPRFSANPLVTATPQIRFYAGAPLVTPDGHALGTLCVLDREPRALDAMQEAALRALSRQVMTQLELRRHVEALREVVARQGLVEERLRLLESVVVNANDAVLITEAEPIDLPGPRILYVNEAFERMTGYSAEEVIGQTPRMLHGPDTVREPLDKIRGALKRWKPVRVEVVNHHKDGTPFWVELNIVPVANESGRYTHWVSVQRETTERKRVETALEAAKSEAEAANHAKSEFLSRMSHELRTPLNAILGFAQLLEMGTPGDDQQESVGHILRGGRHLLALINEVLDIARIESGRLDLSLEPVNVAEILNEALTLVSPLAAGQGVSLHDDPAASCDRHVLADRQRIKQVLLNLLSNAVKYGRRGDGVTLSCVDGAPGRLRIAVRDTGPGIPAEKMPLLFTPFERLGAEQTAVEGTGMGLALSKRLVEAMGGVIGVESRVGVGSGSTFSVELPLVEGPLAALARSGTGTPALATPPTARRTVLYIEDNLPNLQLIQRILGAQRNLTLLSTLQGQMGLDLAREHHPDLILLDLHLPDMSGEEVLRRLQDDDATRRISVIMISADATPGQIERLRGAGAYAYLTKPFDVRRFLQQVTTALRDAER